MSKEPIFEKHMRIAILATAFFVFWIYLGSIINFHQHHIFGRSLMPQGILAKREESIQASPDLPFYLADFSASNDHSDQLIPMPSLMQIEFESGIADHLIPKTGVQLFHGLRAPPVA